MKKAVLLLQFLSLTLISFCQQKLGITEYVANTTIGIQTKSGQKVSNGTGFFFTFQTSQGAAPVVITGRRLLEDCQTVTFFFLESNFAGLPQYGKTQEITLNTSDLLVFNHPDKEVDLAMIPMTAVLTHFISKKIRISYHPMAENIIPKDSLANTLNPVETVYQVGYPSQIRKELGGTPFIKKGITSTPIFVDFNQRKEFLFDIPFYEGSPGAPVFIYQNSNPNRTDQRMEGQRIFLAGVTTTSVSEIGASIAVKAQQILAFKKMLEAFRQ